MQGRIKHLLWVGLACMLVACGGGGGGGSSSTPAPNGTFDLSTTSLSFTAATPISTVASQTITLSNLGPDAAAIRVSSTSGGAIASWLSVTISGSTGTVTANPSSLSVGTYNTVVRVASFSSSGAQLFSRDVNVQLVVTSNLWSIYDASALPNATGALTQANGSLTQFDLNTGGNSAYSSVAAGILSLDTTAAAGDQHFFVTPFAATNTAATYPKKLTILARLKGDAASDRFLDINSSFGDTGATAYKAQITFGSSFTGSSLTNTKLSLNNVNGGGAVYSSNFDATNYHVFHIAITMNTPSSGTVLVYLDGNATPILNQTVSSFPAAAVGENNLRLGDTDSTYTRKGSLDWLVWTNSDAYTPAQLSGKLPAGFTSTGY
ncbi:hypothetical protein VVD49_00690 [Uliginosibacterium sp. H3]|uniref:Uncharacterized protein n=1 Tax=Uliginosibacterium silvisoli TaxID=3114758 RepID=A0ABU6JXB4_9RHOO|nr:hypothetical protein [Uliginosibacterium sp. H3]